MLARWPVMIVCESFSGCGESSAAGEVGRVSAVQMQILLSANADHNKTGAPTRAL